VDSRLLTLLACPRDFAPLTDEGASLACPHGHRYAVVEGIPIFLLTEVPQTHWVADDALGVAVAGRADAPAAVAEGGIDPFVQQAIGATSGNLYRGVVGRLSRYPLPACPLPPGEGRVLVDVGCNWGRWSLAAARAGYVVIGIDPAFDAVRAARRVARQLGIDAQFIVGDARHLPFRSRSVDVVFSFSVLQHLSEADVAQAAASMGRVLAERGECLVQMASRWGVRSLMQQARRRFRRPKAFEVRYWTPGALRACFTQQVGTARLEPDAYLSLNARPEDADLLSAPGRAVVTVSQLMVAAAKRVPPLTWLADSVWVRARLKG
jgi:SAM-dependent methyltransferase